MRRRLLTPILLSLLLFVAADNAFGQFDGNIWYRIAAKHSGKCLTAPVGTSFTGNGVLPVIEQDCSESEANQMWQILPADDGYYRIVAKQNERQVLSVYGGIVSQGDGAVIQLWTYNHGWNQMWSFICLNNGFYQLFARHSHNRDVLDINLGSDPTPYAQQWRNLHGENQKFLIQPFAAGPAYRSPTPTTCPSETAANISFNLYSTDNGVYRVISRAGVNQPIALNFMNQTDDPIYWNQTLVSLFREGGLQVERLDGRTWFPVLPAGRCPAGGTDVNGTGIPAAPLTQLIRVPPSRNSTHRWTIPAALGPGTYRLSLAYYRSSNTRGVTPSFVCSSTFQVAR